MRDRRHADRDRDDRTQHGSDLAGIKTAAVRDGDHYILTGAKTFITGGLHADAVIVVARTLNTDDRRAGLSLLVVEDGMPGFAKGANLDKLGLPVQDTAELAFDHVRVPAANLLGEEGQAFRYLTHNLAGERLGVAVNAISSAQAALNVTVDYVRNRRVFGKPLSDFQKHQVRAGRAGHRRRGRPGDVRRRRSRA